MADTKAPEADTGPVKSAYSADKYARLLELKKKYDPDRPARTGVRPRSARDLQAV